MRSWQEWQKLGKNRDHYPYLFPEEEAPINAAFDGLFDTIESRDDTETGNVALFQRGPASGRPPPGKQNVEKLARSILGVNPDQGAIPVITLDTAEQLPQAVRDDLEAEGTPLEDIRGVHWEGKPCLIADQLTVGSKWKK